MLWFKFILGLIFFELVSVLFAIVPDYGNEYTTKENKNWTSFKNFAPKLKLIETTTAKIWTARSYNYGWEAEGERAFRHVQYVGNEIGL